jgi:hypothetical protein
MKRTAFSKRILATLAFIVGSVPAMGQTPDGGERPIPRWDDGRVNLGAPLGETGMWFRGENYLAVNPNSYEPQATRNSRIHIDDIPAKDWARALVDARNETYLANEPYTRCLPSGGPRHFIAFYGMELLDLPEIGRMYMFIRAISGSYRTIYMDGRPHPENRRPTFFGHSVGHWEGETLVIDTVGMNERFWMNREGLPHTEQLHLIERVTRTSFDRLDYTVTVDDPGAYDAPWTSGYTLRWNPGGGISEYVCQENNQSPEGMVVGSQGRFVP